MLRKYHATVDMLPQVMIAVHPVARGRAAARPRSRSPADLAVLAVMVASSSVPVCPRPPPRAILTATELA
jgi:hypothetical protein